MTCRDGVALLMDYVEGALARPVSRAVTRHVSGCPRCRAFVASYLATPRLLREAIRPRMPRRVGRALRLRIGQLARLEPRPPRRG